MELEISKSNQKGFVLVLFLSLLPVIVIAFSGLAIVLLFLEAKSESQHLCRQALFQAQKQVGQNLMRLMQLNGAAKALRIQLKAAEAELALAAGTPAAVAILAQIAEIKEQKSLLGQQQKALILESEMEMRTGSLRSELGVRSSLHQKQIRFAQLTELSSDGVSSSPVHLAVRPDDPSDTAPIYELESPFTEKQSLQTSWKLKSSWNKKHWISRNLHWRQISVDNSCRASLEVKNNHFRPVLNEDKF